MIDSARQLGFGEETKKSLAGMDDRESLRGFVEESKKSLAAMDDGQSLRGILEESKESLAAMDDCQSLVEEWAAMEEEQQLCTHRLPSEILAKIFSCLPVPSILQLRSVCKLWNSIISSPSFPNLWSQHSSPRPPWIIMFHSLELIAAFNPSSSHWYTISVPLPPCFTRKRILASASGLLCIGFFCDSCRLLIVCNPVTRDRRILPQLPLQGESFLAGMVVDEINSCYKIYVADAVENDVPFGGNVEAMVYCSVDDSWLPLQPGQLSSLEGCLRDHGVLYRGTFFSLSKGGPPHQLTTYNTLEEEFTSLQLPFERSMSLFPSLCASEGRLFLAGGVWEHLPFSSFNIWELDRTSWKFVEIDATPCATLDDRFIAPLPLQTLQRVGKGDLLFFHARVLLCPLIYDLAEKSWHCMPRYYGPCQAWVPAITYEPSFSAKV